MKISSLLAVLLLAAPAFASDPIPDAVGKAKLKMTDEEAKAAFPGLTLKVADSSNSTAAPPFHYGEASAVELGNFGDLKGCKAQLRFFQHQLINIDTTCADKAATGAYLNKTLGEPSAGSEDAVRWTGSERTVVYSPKVGNFAIADKQLTEAFNKQLLALVMQAKAGVAANKTPVTTPAAKP